MGRGVYLRPHHPYELRRLLFTHGPPRDHLSRETNQLFAIPSGYELDESPPSPNGVALNTITIEESWERFHEQRSLDAHVAAQSSVFSINASMSHGSELRSDQESYYATRSSFVALWSLYIEDPSAHADIDTAPLPVPFQPKHREAYESFFQRYGTHYIKRAWVGGRAEVVVSVAKSTNLSKSEIQAALSANVGAVSGQVEARASKSREQLHSNSRCTVLGRGGDERRLAAMGELDQASYNAWIATIRDNPQTIELEVAGIWTLLSDQPKKAEALKKAYSAASSFRAIAAVFRIDDLVYFLRGRNFFSYDLENGQSTRERPVADKWPELDKIGFERIDAAFQFKGLTSGEDRELDHKIYMFRRDEYIAVDVETGKVDEGPKKIRDGWPGVPFKKIDAVVATDMESIYFFAGGQYVRFNGRTGKVDEGYPQSIQTRWIGLTLERVDAAIYWGGGKIYFFRGDQHFRYDIVTLRADPGYPKPVLGNYVEDWKFFD
ncbi:MAG: hemopexin repeat-containing protein [Myxococcota bacterium]